MKTTIDPSMRLTENFTLAEFLRSDTAARHHISNQPTWAHVLNMRNLCREVLQPLRDHFGPIHLSSGYRCERLNELVHGVGASQHLVGEAADIRLASREQGREYYDFILNHTNFDKLLFEYNRRGVFWLHVSCRFFVRENRHLAIPNFFSGR